MKITRAILLLLLLPAILLSDGCNYSGKSFSGYTSKVARASLLDKYPRSPGEEIFRQAQNGRLYTELEARYREALFNMQVVTNKDGAKLVVVILTQDVGKSLSLANTYGIPYITQACTQMGIDCLDLSTVMSINEPADMTQGHSDGNWTKAGAQYIADQLSYMILGYDSVKNTKPFPKTHKPATFGDLQPHEDDVLEVEKGVPLHIATNSQGLRMDHNVIFPKTKQTILFMGDVEILSPYADNHFTPTYLLQLNFPGKEIVNAAYMHYTMEDYVSLYVEKARYTEPDIVVVCTNGQDILDCFFTERNHYSRDIKVYRPSEAEKQFYEHMN